MACVPLPAPPALPSLGPLSLTPTLPSLGFDPTLCCKLLPFPVATPPIPFPAGVYNPAVAVALAAALDTVRAYLDALPTGCPKE